MTENLWARDIPCPKCGVFMRRIYIQQQYTSKAGKRSYKFRSVGRACLSCKIAVFELPFR